MTFPMLVDSCWLQNRMFLGQGPLHLWLFTMFKNDQFLFIRQRWDGFTKPTHSEIGWLVMTRILVLLQNHQCNFPSWLGWFMLAIKLNGRVSYGLIITI